jgi:hypothetical protein
MSTNSDYDAVEVPKQASRDRRPAGTKHDHPLNKKPPADGTRYGPSPRLGQHDRQLRAEVHGDSGRSEPTEMHDMSRHLLHEDCS